MRIRTKSIVTAIALLSLVSGAVGCRMNGTGPWYNPQSYSWHNPFNHGDAPARDDAPAHAMTAKPSMGMSPEVSIPPGGYAQHGSAEADFFAGSSQKPMATQYSPAQNESVQVAANPYAVQDPAAVAGMQSSYNPYAMQAQNLTPNANYQQTSARSYENNATTAIPSNNVQGYGQQYNQQFGEQPASPHMHQGMTPSAIPQGGQNNPMPTSTPYSVTPNPYTTMAPSAVPNAFNVPSSSETTQSATNQYPVNHYANAQANYGVAAATPFDVNPQPATPAFPANPVATPTTNNGYMASPSNYQPY